MGFSSEKVHTSEQIWHLAFVTFRIHTDKGVFRVFPCGLYTQTQKDALV